MDFYKILKEKNQVELEPSFLMKLKNILSNQLMDNIILNIELKSLNSNMNLNTFFNLLINIENQCKQELEFNKDFLNYDTTRLMELSNKFKNVFSDMSTIYEITSKKHLDRIVNNIDLCYELLEEYKKFHIFRDLLGEKKYFAEDLKCYKDDKTTTNWIKEFDEATDKNDIKKMQQMQSDVQKEILEIWSTSFNNIEQMDDDNFAFIGHSTSFTDFSKPFYSKYISTSLFTNEINDTYRDGFGFILAPKNIINADVNDMYINNYANQQSNVRLTSSAVRIRHPKTIIAECKKKLEENIKNKDFKKVYNEVVIDGFEPIGIFCFTDGTKSLNENEENAKKLQESFPNLKIYKFDTMKSKKDGYLEQTKLNLINNLRLKFSPDFPQIDINKLNQFDYFFNEFDKLKKSSNYDETMIEKVFKENMKMLSCFLVPSDLFNGDFKEEEIRYSLEKNEEFNFEKILCGYATVNDLIKLKIFIQFKDKLEPLYPGISNFLELLDKVEITKDMIKEINSKKILDFKIISQIIKKKVHEELQSKSNFLYMKKETISKKIKDYKLKEQKKKYYHNVLEHQKDVFGIKNEYFKITSNINELINSEENLNIEVEKYQSEMERIEENLNLIENNLYENSNEHKEIESKLESIKNNISELKKHPIVNFIKLIKENKKIRNLKKDDKNYKQHFENNKTEQLKNINNIKNDLKSKYQSLIEKIKNNKITKEELQNKKAILNKKIKEYFDVDSIDEMESKINEAILFINDSDSDNLIKLQNAENVLEGIEFAISEINEQYLNVLGEKTKFVR